MHYCIIIVCVIAVSASGGIIKNNAELKWPENYYVKAFKMSLTAGRIQQITAWRTSNYSTIEYNDGAVKSLVVGANFTNDTSYTVAKITFKPEATENQTYVMVSKKKLYQYKLLDEILETILPKYLEKYKFIGMDTSLGGNYSVYREEDSDYQNSLVVKYDEGSNIWIPIRFEEKRYNKWLESITSHNLWEFYNFKIITDDIVSFEEYVDLENKADIMGNEEITSGSLFMAPDNTEHVDHSIESFKDCNAQVNTDNEEHELRRNIFQRNMRLVNTTNEQNLGYKLTINKFADRTPAELERYRGLKKSNEDAVGTIAFPYTEADVQKIAQTLPKYFDLRIEGLVTPVQDQGDCGSAWSFGATTAVEGALARKNGGRLIRLSNQAIIDCAWSFGASGCESGNVASAYEWIKKHGIPSVQEYGLYAEMEGFCHINNMTKVHHIEGYTKVTPQNIEALKVAIVYHGPLTVSMHATDTLHLYSGGILYDLSCDPDKLNHVVTLVGYGEENGETYWIVKNSWGTTWGVDGYFHITARDNNCGITNEPTYPNVV